MWPQFRKFHNQLVTNGRGGISLCHVYPELKSFVGDGESCIIIHNLNFPLCILGLA